MQLKEIKKLYYSIGDVSKMTDLKQYVLRYWETEFKILNLEKNRAGNRRYKKEDIQIIRHIKELLYEKKFTTSVPSNTFKTILFRYFKPSVVKISRKH